MLFTKSLGLSAVAATSVLAYPPQLGFNTPATVETRTLDEIYQAALKEGGTVTLWHGGDETYQLDADKKAFEARFPGMTLNVTVDLSKYHDVNIDRLLATKNVYVDSVMFQTLHDFPRWKAEGAILNYKPVGFERKLPNGKSKRDSDGMKTSTSPYETTTVPTWACPSSHGPTSLPQNISRPVIQSNTRTT